MHRSDVSLSLPHSTEAEKAVLGAILRDSEQFHRVLSKVNLQPEHFYQELHRDMFSVMQQHDSMSKPIDIISIAEGLQYLSEKDSKNSKDINPAYLVELIETSPITENIEFHANLIKKILKTLENKNFKLIFSAHGLPEKNIKKGDPYQWQIEKSVERIMNEINDVSVDYVLSYQSRVGPLKWIGPSTEEVIIKNSKLNKHLVIVPIAFVSEHSETLVELDIEYEKLAKTNGCNNYTRIEALGVNENFIDGLSDLVLNNEEYKFTNNLYPPKNRCPSNFTKCPCLN